MTSAEPLQDLAKLAFGTQLERSWRTSPTCAARARNPSPRSQICKPLPEPTTCCGTSRPQSTAHFAADCDAAVATCLDPLVRSGDQPPAAAVQASQPALGFGGLGLRSATAVRCFLARHAPRYPCSPPADCRQPPARAPCCPGLPCPCLGCPRAATPSASR